MPVITATIINTAMLTSSTRKIHPIRPDSGNDDLGPNPEAQVQCGRARSEHHESRATCGGLKSIEAAAIGFSWKDLDMIAIDTLYKRVRATPQSRTARKNFQ